MKKPRCVICNTTKIDKPWMALAKDGVVGPNLLAIGRVRHGNTGLSALGMRPMPDDDGVMRCVACLQAWNGRKGGIVTGEELICCGQEWKPRQATREAESAPPIPMRPPTLTAEVLRKATMEVARTSMLSSRLVVTLMTARGIEKREAEWVFGADAIDVDATVDALVERAVADGVALP